MSRHRIVRSMNYEDEFYDDDDEYSRSVEDNYCISPSTAAQFTWNREKNVNFAAYMGEGEVINEEEEEETEEEGSFSRHDSLSDSANAARLQQLSDIEKAQLNSCLEEAHSILGESVPESVMVDVIIQNHFNLETAINQLICQQDAPKPQREPRQRRNRSQDDIDNVELDNLLAEIQGLESSHSPVFSQEGLRFTSAAYHGDHDNEDVVGDKLDLISDHLHDVSLGDKTETSVISDDRAKSVSNHSKVSINFISSKKAVNQKQNDSDHDGKLSVTSHTQQNVKISLADLAKNSSVKKDTGTNSLKQHQHIPSKLLSSSQPSAKGLEDNFKPKQETAVSLSDLVKQAHNDKGTRPFSASVGESGKGERTQALSLAELALQHKKPSVAAARTTSPSQPPAFISNAQRVHEGMASLSALVAQHSAHKKESSDKPMPAAGHLSSSEKAGTQSGHSTEPLSIPSGNKSAPKSSLSDLIKAHGQPGKSSNISLSQLAAQHRQSTPPSASTSPMSTMQSLGKPSMSSLLKNLTLDESESKPVPVSGSTTNTLSMSASPSSGVPVGFSLSSCLKTTKSSNKGDITKQLPIKSKKEMYFQDDFMSDVPSESEVVRSPMFSWSSQGTDAALLSDASSLGIVLCCVRRKRKYEDSAPSDSRKPVKYPKFMCLAQLSNRKIYTEHVYHKITPFNFSSPSPDDVVRNKQKQAFTRSDKEFVV